MSVAPLRFESYPEPEARATSTLRASLTNWFKPSEVSRRRRVIVCVVIFLLAFGVRWLSWQDNRGDAWKVETFVTLEYKESGRQLQNGDWRAAAVGEDSQANPPGYAILLALIFKACGESDKAIAFTQIFCDSISVVFVFLIAAELLSFTIAIISGALAALAPQLAYYSILLLPDSLSVLPVLAAAYFLIRAVKHRKLFTFALAGAFIGLSCWLRANALLLAPWLVCFTPLLLKRCSRLRPSIALICCALIVIAPISIKNAIAFHRFIPISLGGGQKLLQGIAEYDQGRFDIPKTDLGIMRQEAEMYGRPDYALLLFGSDGPERDRLRIRRGVRVIASNPFWYGSVMARRALSFLRLARVPITTIEPPISHPLNTLDKAPVWSESPADFLTNSDLVSRQARLAIASNGQLKIESDETKYGIQIASTAIPLTQFHDYVLRLPMKLEDGRLSVSVVDGSQRHALYSVPIELTEGVAAQDQPTDNLALPFVSGTWKQVRLSIANNGAATPRSSAELGRVELFDLGPSARDWMRYVRFPIRILQMPFMTACVLPFMIIGIAALSWTRNFRSLILLLLVPLYYIIFQSALHTERRYVIAIHYFFLILASAGFVLVIELFRQAGVKFSGLSTKPPSRI